MSKIKSGGSEGGERAFVAGLGLILFGLGLYLFLDSVRVTSAPYGWISGRMGGGRGMGETTSMGIVFVPFLAGITILFFDSEKKWAWVLAGLGLAVVAIEILSRVRFVLEMKTTHLLLVLGMVAAGAGLILRSYVISAPDDQDNANKS
ncbi:hypothetical protein N9221_00300 [Akkermansiaceae bacterium]|nr:hypothetical protein [Akkermansiaceae bacterium]MDB4462287.1 hypothetical protein [bacterium]MDB4505083.1 hypothetical protein [Akkermansiaceae bacterium]MDB4546015.1 hypothetical protein [Akkermansiaceae bacterium]